MGFPTPTSPLTPLQMLSGDGERVLSSDEDGDDEDDDDDEDEFEDSEPTEATATEVEGSLASEGDEVSATPDKWVAVKSSQTTEHPSPQPLPGVVVEAVPALSR